MRDEAKVEDTEVGRVPADDGWHILNLSEIRWATVPGGGTWCGFGLPEPPVRPDRHRRAHPLAR